MSKEIDNSSKNESSGGEKGKDTTRSIGKFGRTVSRPTNVVKPNKPKNK